MLARVMRLESALAKAKRALESAACLATMHGDYVAAKGFELDANRVQAAIDGQEEPNGR